MLPSVRDLDTFISIDQILKAFDLGKIQLLSCIWVVLDGLQLLDQPLDEPRKMGNSFTN